MHQPVPQLVIHLYHKQVHQPIPQPVINLYHKKLHQPCTKTYQTTCNQHVGMFYRQRMLVIDGKYNNDDGLSTTTMINNAMIIGEEKQP